VYSFNCATTQNSENLLNFYAILRAVKARSGPNLCYRVCQVQ
jgi:hypothetical protein